MKVVQKAFISRYKLLILKCSSLLACHRVPWKMNFKMDNKVVGDINSSSHQVVSFTLPSYLTIRYFMWNCNPFLSNPAGFKSSGRVLTLVQKTNCFSDRESPAEPERTTHRPNDHFKIQKQSALHSSTESRLPNCRKN